MRGLQTPVRAIRRQVFTEAAKLGLKANSETLLDDMEEIPYKIVNEDTEQYTFQDSVKVGIYEDLRIDFTEM